MAVLQIETARYGGGRIEESTEEKEKLMKLMAVVMGLCLFANIGTARAQGAIPFKHGCANQEYVEPEDGVKVRFKITFASNLDLVEDAGLRASKEGFVRIAAEGSDCWKHILEARTKLPPNYEPKADFVRLKFEPKVGQVAETTITVKPGDNFIMMEAVTDGGERFRRKQWLTFDYGKSHLVLYVIRMERKGDFFNGYSRIVYKQLMHAINGIPVELDGSPSTEALKFDLTGGPVTQKIMSNSFFASFVV